MPINFELTFTQPFLTQLDTGQARGSKDMARFVTNSYIRTMLTGLPGGGSVPPVLPAPGLGSPPPPFPIPSVPINNYSSRQRAMQRILQTYFEAREILIMQGNIKSTIKSVALAIRKAQKLKQQINQLLSEAAEIQRQILELPLILEQIKQAVVLIVDREKQKINSLLTRVDQFRVEFNTQNFNARFARELFIIDTISNFKPTADLNSYKVFFDALQTLESRLSTLPDVDDGSEEQSFRLYINNQLRTVLKSMVSVVGALTAPENFIDYFKQLASVDSTLSPVLAVMYRYRFIRRKLQPKVAKIRKKLQELVQKLETSIKIKIQEQKAKLQDYLKKLATKKSGSGKKELYKKAGKIVGDFKKTYLKKIKKVRRTITEVRAIIKLAQNLVIRSTTFKQNLELVANRSLSDYINQFVGNVTATVTQPVQIINQQNIELNRILDRAGITFLPIRIAILRQLIGVVSTPTLLLRYLESSSQDVIRVYREFLAIIKDANELEIRVRNLIGGKSANSSLLRRDAATGRNADNKTIVDILTIPIIELESFFNKLNKKLNRFVKTQEDKLRIKLQKLKEEVKIKLIMLVPLRSDLMDGKTKAEILQAKKDKIKNTKEKIKKAIKIITILVGRIYPAVTGLVGNLNKLEWRYSVNGGFLDKLIDGIFEIKKLNTTKDIEKKQLEEKKRKLMKDIRDYFYGFELLAGFVITMFNEMSQKGFAEAFAAKLFRGTVGTLAQGYVDLYNKITVAENLQGAKMGDIIAFFSDTYSFRALSKTYVKSALRSIEQRYLADTIVLARQLTENTLIQRLFPGFKYEVISLIDFVFSEMRKLIVKIKEFLQKIYSNTVKPLFDRINEKRIKIQEDINQWLKTHVAKRALNLDLKLMTIAFNLATRAFWTGFSWTTPNGVRYTCTSIGVFLPLKTKVDSGASVLVRELSRNLNLQLTQMVGLVSPPPPTGIPPFPFAGYR